eukprot:COSAG02_NODE_999_length_15328_cov_8.086360_2_plen_337_part_00
MVSYSGLIDAPCTVRTPPAHARTHARTHCTPDRARHSYAGQNACRRSTSLSLYHIIRIGGKERGGTRVYMPLRSRAAGTTRLLPAAVSAAALTVGGCVILHLRHSCSGAALACPVSERPSVQRELQLEPEPEPEPEPQPQQEPEPEPEPQPKQEPELSQKISPGTSGHWRKRGNCRGDDEIHCKSEEARQAVATDTRGTPISGNEGRSKPAVSLLVSATGVDKAARLRLNGGQRFRAVVQYDGTDFEGWQTQPNGKTIQDELEKRLGSILLGRGKRLAVAGSGRTDAGVHAKAQVFHFECPLDHWAFDREQGGDVKSQAELTAERLLHVMRHGMYC